MIRDCPRRMLRERPEVVEMMRAYSMMSRGFLPESGAVNDQTASFVHAMEVIEDERASILKERHR